MVPLAIAEEVEFISAERAENGKPVAADIYSFSPVLISQHQDSACKGRFAKPDRGLCGIYFPLSLGSIKVSR